MRHTKFPGIQFAFSILYGVQSDIKKSEKPLYVKVFALCISGERRLFGLILEGPLLMWYEYHPAMARTLPLLRSCQILS